MKCILDQLFQYLGGAQM